MKFILVIFIFLLSGIEANSQATRIIKPSPRPIFNQASGIKNGDKIPRPKGNSSGSSVTPSANTPSLTGSKGHNGRQATFSEPIKPAPKAPPKNFNADQKKKKDTPPVQNQKDKLKPKTKSTDQKKVADSKTFNRAPPQNQKKSTDKKISHTSSTNATFDRKLENQSFDRLVKSLPKKGQENVEKLRNWAKSQGYVKKERKEDPKFGGYTRRIIILLGGYELRHYPLTGKDLNLEVTNQDLTLN